MFGKQYSKDPKMAVLEAEIERGWLEMNDFGAEFGELHPEVLIKSHMLDELIIQHMRAQLTCKKPTA